MAAAEMVLKSSKLLQLCPAQLISRVKKTEQRQYSLGIQHSSVLNCVLYYNKVYTLGFVSYSDTDYTEGSVGEEF